MLYINCFRKNFKLKLFNLFYDENIIFVLEVDKDNNNGNNNNSRNNRFILFINVNEKF